jgi:hypothetical protein
MDLYCYHCGQSLAKLSLPLGRRDECPSCSRQLHVCLMCVHYDVRETTKQCREDDAEEVRDKAKANFCEYFSPNPAAFDPSALTAERRARNELDALFGDAPEDPQAAGSPAGENPEDLFRS